MCVRAPRSRAHRGGRARTAPGGYRGCARGTHRPDSVCVRAQEPLRTQHTDQTVFLCVQTGNSLRAHTSVTLRAIRINLRRLLDCGQPNGSIGTLFPLMNQTKVSSLLLKFLRFSL